MKVKCQNTGGAALLEADIAAGNTRSSEFHVTVGREYAAYGVLFSDGVVGYLIQDDTNLPDWNPASLFQVIDGRVSKSWVCVDWSSPVRYVVVMSFPELVQSPEVFDQLALGDNAARATFFRLQQVADLEFLDLSVERTAEVLNDNWLQCPFCGDAWESGSLDAMVRCPSCRSVSRNPRYRPQ